MISIPLIALLAVPALFALTLTLLNMASWPAGKPGGRHSGTVSVLVPARNEEANIEACVRAIVASRHPIDEVLVYNDQSTDGTSAILRRLCLELPTLRVVGGEPVPPGWVGKPHACHQLAKHASGDLLLFVDADTKLYSEGLERLAWLFSNRRADIVTAVPRQLTGSWVERMMIPLLTVTYTSWLWLPLIYLTRDPRFVAANGQLMAVTRRCYDRIGGFEAVKSEIVDDVAFCRHAKRSGARVVFADGRKTAECRMYNSPLALWLGFSKNIYEGIGNTLVGLLAVLTLYTTVFVLPYGALLVGVLTSAHWLPLALLGVVCNLIMRGALALRYGHSLGSVILHPVAVLGLLAIALNSFRWSRRGRLLWAGRAYASRQKRLEGEACTPSE